MTILEEYRNQSTWRNWESYLECLPIKSSDTIIDLGCGIGTVTNLLAQKAALAIGVDINSDFLNEAIRTKSSSNIQYINSDLRNLMHLNLPLVDGIWTSFTIAYFPEFNTIFDNWLSLLKPGGWIAIVEMNDLFAHFPLNEQTRQRFRQYYERQRQANIYDFEMGSKIRDFLRNKGLVTILEQTKTDKELSFSGPAESQVLTAWEKRFDRMIALRNFIGERIFPNVKQEFLECLKHDNHSCNTEVKFFIAQATRKKTVSIL